MRRANPCAVKNPCVTCQLSAYVDSQLWIENTVFEPQLVEFSDEKPRDTRAKYIFIEKIRVSRPTVQNCSSGVSCIYNIVSPGLVYNPCILNNIFIAVYPFQNYEAFDFLVKFFNNSILCSGENIVKGDKESIKNLLEIFDGLLEYLTEHISETSHERSKFKNRNLVWFIFMLHTFLPFVFLPVFLHRN